MCGTQWPPRAGTRKGELPRATQRPIHLVGSGYGCADGRILKRTNTFGAVVDRKQIISLLPVINFFALVWSVLFLRGRDLEFEVVGGDENHTALRGSLCDVRKSALLPRLLSAAPEPNSRHNQLQSTTSICV